MSKVSFKLPCELFQTALFVLIGGELTLKTDVADWLRDSDSQYKLVVDHVKGSDIFMDVYFPEIVFDDAECALLFKMRWL